MLLVELLEQLEPGESLQIARPARAQLAGKLIELQFCRRQPNGKVSDRAVFDRESLHAYRGDLMELYVSRLIRRVREKA